MNKENIQEAIEVLKEAREKTSKLLTFNPALKVRTDNALDTLVNGLSHTIQGNVTHAGTVQDFSPITHIFGQKVANTTEAVIPVKIELKNEDVEQLRVRAKAAHATFLGRDNKELMDSLTDMEIRAVAVISGVEVSETEPKRITAPFIDKIKAAIIQKQAEDKAAADAIETTKQTEAKSVTLPAKEEAPVEETPAIKPITQKVAEDKAAEVIKTSKPSPPTAPTAPKEPSLRRVDK